ncbi:hypothetical protein BGW42_001313 [Actinomortierella wolfii]|nr:hypothetical protein BGW42_001313 [Actinomortierella wolfii]
MVVKDIKSQPISAPVPVPGTQMKPTTPGTAALSAAGSTTIIHISSNRANHERTSASASAVSASKATLSNGSRSVGSTESSGSFDSSGGSNGHRNKHHDYTDSSTAVTMSRVIGSSSQHGGGQSNNNQHNQQQQRSGLRRLTSIGSKKLSNENMTLRAKVSELERYLTGLKEELIIAHRQIHAKAEESKAMEERTSLEIHELEQHIQRCELDLLTKTAECEALQRKLQYQTKDHMTKLKQIDMLEAEIMDIRRMSLNGSNKPSEVGSTTATLGDENAGGDGNTGRSESVRSSVCGEGRRTSSLYEDMHEQLRLLKDEGQRKDKTIQELLDKVDRLATEVLNLEREKARLEQLQQPEQQKEGDKKECRVATPQHRLSSPPPPLTERRITAKAIIAATTPTCSSSNLSMLGGGVAKSPSGSMTESSFSSAPETRASPATAAVSATMKSNNVGHDIQAEHSKLLSKYQTLQRNYAEVMEYVQAIESENRELRVQVLDVSLNDLSIGSPSAVAMST